jgi:HK97 gp10 family phage protein
MDFVDNSEKVRREIQQRLVAGLNNANEFLMSEAQAGAPVRSGNLRDGIGTVQEASEASPIAAGASRAPYSARVNRGSSNTEARPFWTSAWLRMKNGFPGFFKQ